MLKPLPEPSVPEGIRSQVYKVDREASELAWAICVVKFEGAVPDGSAGRDHAEYIKLACLDGMIRLDAICIVMDMSDLDYRWGDSIGVAFDALRKRFFYDWDDIGMSTPVKVVASDRSIGLQSLLPADMLFDDVASAIASCNEDLARWSAD